MQVIEITVVMIKNTKKDMYLEIMITGVRIIEKT